MIFRPWRKQWMVFQNTLDHLRQIWLFHLKKVQNTILRKTFSLVFDFQPDYRRSESFRKQDCFYVSVFFFFVCEKHETLCYSPLSRNFAPNWAAVFPVVGNFAKIRFESPANVRLFKSYGSWRSCTLPAMCRMEEKGKRQGGRAIIVFSHFPYMIHTSSRRKRIHLLAWSALNSCVIILSKIFFFTDQMTSWGHLPGNSFRRFCSNSGMFWTDGNCALLCSSSRPCKSKNNSMATATKSYLVTWPNWGSEKRSTFRLCRAAPSLFSLYTSACCVTSSKLNCNTIFCHVVFTAKWLWHKTPPWNRNKKNKYA